MQADPFYFDSDSERPAIRHRYNEQFALELYDLATESFIAPAGRLTMFGLVNGNQVAFVATTEHARIREISNALTWYGDSIGQDLQITTIDPRPPVKLRIVR